MSNQNYPTCRSGHKCFFVKFKINPQIKKKIMIIRSRTEKIDIVGQGHIISYKGQRHIEFVQHMG